MLKKQANWRWNPFTNTNAYSTITEERHVVDGSPYWVKLNEVPDPDYSHPTSGTALHIETAGGTTLSQVSTSPSANEFRPDLTFETGYIEFNSANDGDEMLISYRAMGSPNVAELFNTLMWLGGAIATPVFLGDGSDGDVTISSSTGLAATDGNICIKQYTNLTINASQTLSINTGVYGLIIAVQGKLKLGSGSKITANAVGAQAAAPNIGSPGGYGGGGGGYQTAKGGAGGGMQHNSAVGAQDYSNNPFYPGAGYGGDAGTAGSPAGKNGGNTAYNDTYWWRSLERQMVYGAGGGGGGPNVAGGGSGGRGGGFIIINANIIDSDSGAAFEAKGGAGAVSGSYGAGGGGAGGTIFILSYHEMIGETAANMEANDCDVSGGAGGATTVAGGNGSAGLKKVIDSIYEHGVF